MRVGEEEEREGEEREKRGRGRGRGGKEGEEGQNTEINRPKTRVDGRLKGEGGGTDSFDVSYDVRMGEFVEDVAVYISTKNNQRKGKGKEGKERRRSSSANIPSLTCPPPPFPSSFLRSLL